MLSPATTTDTLRPTRQPTPKAHKQINQKHNHHSQQNHKLNILPPHLAPETLTPHTELMRTATQAIRLINQEINPLAPLQNPLDILRHNIPHVINLALHVRNRVLLPRLRGAILHHQLLQLGVETARAVVGQAGEIGAVGGELGQEAGLDLDEETEGDPAAGGAVGDHQEGQATCGGRGGVFAWRGRDVVDVVVVVGVR